MGLRDRIAAASLAMPLRDLRRGLMEAGRVPRDLVGPIARDLLARDLPPGAREAVSLVREAAHRAEGRMFDADAPPPREIARAAESLRTGERDGTRTLARVLCFGVERALAALPRARLLVSETVAAAIVADIPMSGDAAERAARIGGALLRDHAVGPVPGTPVPIVASDRPVALRGVHASLLWLLAERPDDPDDEPAIFEICLRLSEGLADEIEHAFETPERLAGELRSLSELV